MPVNVGQIVISLGANTTAFSLSMTRAQQAAALATGNIQGSLSKLTGTVNTYGNAAGRNLGKGLTEIQAMSGLLRVTEGNMTNNIRAAEQFATKILGLGKIAKTIFPIVGGVAMLGIFTELIERAEAVYNWFQKLKNAPLKLRADASEFIQGLDKANASLALTNARLANQIAQLEGRPRNLLAVELQQARLAAIELSDALDKDLKGLQKLLDGGDKKVSFVEQWVKHYAKSDAEDEFKEFGPFQQAMAKPRDAAIDARGELIEHPLATDRARLAAEDKINSDEQAEKEKVLRAELAKTNAELQKRAKLEAEFTGKTIVVPGVGTFQPPVRLQRELGRDGLPTGRQTLQRDFPDNFEGYQGPKALPETLAARRFLIDQIGQIQESQRNVAEERRLEKLQDNAQTQKAERPFENKLHELQAQLAAAQAQLQAMGPAGQLATPTDETFAKAKGQAIEDVSKINDAIRKQHPGDPNAGISLDKQLELLDQHTAIDEAEREKEWKTHLDSTNLALKERIASLQREAQAIGQGWEAQKKANVEAEVAKTLGLNALDPEFLKNNKVHQDEVADLTKTAGTAQDDENANANKQRLTDLQKQIDLETRLASAELRGAEAVRQVRVAYEQRNLALQGFGKAVQDATKQLSDKEQTTQAEHNTKALLDEAQAARELAAAEFQGAAAIRAANLAITQRKLTEANATPDEKNAAASVADARYFQELVTQATKVGNAFQDKLDANEKEQQILTDQLATLQKQGGSLSEQQSLQISLRALEKERATILREQADVLGTAAQGARAYFAELATEGISAAQTVHDALKHTFDSLNDELSKMAAGQKANWASLFQSLSQQLMKTALLNAEAQAAKGLQSVAARQDPNAQQQRGGGVLGTITRGATSILQTLFGKGKGSDQHPHTGDTPSNPTYVSVVNGGAGAGSGNAGGVVPESTQLEPPQLPDLGRLGDPFPLPSPTPRSDDDTPRNVGGDVAAPNLPPLGGVLSKLPLNFGSGAFGAVGSSLVSAGIGLGLGLLSKLFKPENRHLQVGRDFNIPDYGFGGYRALGGAVDAGSAYMVGEEGPEIWTPPASGGSIVPNHVAFGQQGGGDTYIDARGTDPQAVDQRVRSAMHATQKSSVRTSFKTVNEWNLRRPQ